ncbi:hypothetical protein Misp03_67590 [Microbispora sp. NBRC 16548]|nr:hypothetical protein Misp03_67590 [Microbispora sp. NBRC 16548]
MVAIPPELLPQLREHVERYLDKAADGWVFIGPKGARLRRSSFRRTWNKHMWHGRSETVS